MRQLITVITTPFNWLILIILSLPWASLHVGSDPLGLIFVTEAIFLIALLIAFLDQRQRHQLLIGWENYLPWFKIGLILYLLGGLISVFTTELYPVSLGAFKSWVVVPVLFFWWSTSLLTKKDLEQSIKFLIIYAVALSIFGFFNIRQDFHQGRLVAIFRSPNIFAELVAPIFLLNLWFIVVNRKLGSWFWWLTSLVMIVALIMAQSFGSGLALLASIFLAGLVFFTWRVRKWLLLTIAILLVILTYFFFARLNAQGETNAFTGRLEIWQVTTQFLRNKPIFGVGLRGFQPQFIAQAEQILGHPPLHIASAHEHNLYLTLWDQFSIFGLLGILIVLFLTFRSKRASAFQFALIVILVHGLVDTPYLQNDLVLIFWLYLAGSLIEQLSPQKFSPTKNFK